MNNRFIDIYNRQRNEGSNQYEALGIAAHNALILKELDEFAEILELFEDDLHGVDDEPEYNSPLSEFERKQREAGHKNSDFMGGF